MLINSDLCKSIRQVTRAIHDWEISSSHNPYFNLCWHFLENTVLYSKLMSNDDELIDSFHFADNPTQVYMFLRRHLSCKATRASVNIIVASSLPNLAISKF